MASETPLSSSSDAHPAKHIQKTGRMSTGGKAARPKSKPEVVDLTVAEIIDLTGIAEDE